MGLPTFVITFRETLEAALVVGIILVYLIKTENTKYNKFVWGGTFSAIVGSGVAAFLFSRFAGGFTGATEQIFEGATMFAAALLLTTMIFWMLKQKHLIAEHIRAQLSKHIEMEYEIGIFALAFVMVLREGVETVIFLNATAFIGQFDFLSGILGIIVAVGLGFVIFAGIKRIDLKNFFSVTSVLLILFAAGLVAHGVHEFEEAGVVNPIKTPVYNINHILDEKGVVGSFLKALFGYNGNPSLMEVLSYLGYIGLIAIVYYNFDKIFKIQQPIATTSS
ncbi:TPA: FTR1 family protein [archaeon]|uniref:FTR1 family protein n=1 Tax=Candidatus Naiadarchaeum limnaeum TaxID=2756139 RepID=A0A832V9W7_9ARCH|nr:FTR1 family protein [Candidatus Naiadarchaeales archaeon SRR2090153.bin1042]HIK00256.1 FTR1 family protein [Candidatus Naiadarchaeum limnaeum]